MIHYQLRCSQGHEFDGWFTNSAGFELQAARGLVECPACGAVKVERALMTPAVSTRAALPVPSPTPPPADTPAPAPETPTPAVAATAGKLPDQLRGMLQRMRAEVEKNCDYVGPNFADEARRMHRGESDRHAIYGETTPDQAEALSDEGIDFSSIPWVPRADG